MKKQWVKYKLGEVATVIGGYAFKSKDFKSYGVPVVKIKSLKENNIVISEGQYLDESFLAINKKYHVNKNDFLIALTGSHITMPSSAVGRVAKSRKKETLLLNQRVGKFVVNSKLCFHNFLYYFTTSQYFFESIGLRSKGAANQANVSSKDVEGIELLLPKLEEQKKIASILSAYDGLIENNLKRIKLLEERAQLTYQEWFVRMKYPGHENDVVDSETGLPEGWTFQSIGVLTNKLESGKRPKGGIDKSLNQGVPSIGAENVNGLGKYNYSKEKYITEECFSTMNKGIIENKDILIYKDGAYIGKVAIFQDSYPHKKCCVNEHVFLINTGEEILQNLLYFTLETNDYFKKMQGLNSNSAQPGINQAKLKSLEIVLPKHELCNSFYIVTEPILKLISTLALQNESLKLSRDILLPRLMSGMIDIDEIKYNYPKEISV